MGASKARLRKKSHPPPSTKHLGDAWVKSARSAILELPSAIIPGKTHYLLNTTHPDFKSITFGKPEVFAFDPRLPPDLITYP